MNADPKRPYTPKSYRLHIPLVVSARKQSAYAGIMRMKSFSTAIVFALLATHQAEAQGTQVPTVISLQDALNRAKLFDSQFLTTTSDALLAKEDRLQAKAAMFPTLSATTGIHVYRAWAVMHQDLSTGHFDVAGSNWRFLTPCSKAKTNVQSLCCPAS